MSDTPERHVAVVVVHGVGYRPPGESASEVAHLLLRLTPDETGAPADGSGARYPVFHEEPLDYALQPLEVVPDDCAADDHSSTPDRTFMRELLEDYVPDPSDRICESVRFCAERRQSGADPATVHVYEVYWSDISALGRNVLSIFASFYSLILHVPVLGLQTLGFARQSDGDALSPGGWNAWTGLYRTAFFLFGIIVPVLTLLMIPLALAIIPVTQRDDLREIIAAVVPVAAAIGIVFVVQFARQATVTMRAALLSLVAGAVVAAVVAWYWRFMLSPQVILFEWWFIGGALLFPVLAALHRERGRVLPLGVASWLVLTAMLIGFSVRHAREATTYRDIRAQAAAAGTPLANPVQGFHREEQEPGRENLLDDTHGRLDDELDHELARRTALFSILNTFEWSYVALSSAWVLFALTFLVTVLVAWWLTRGSGREPARAEALARLRRVAFTARLALATPAVAFVFASFFAWGAYYNLVAQGLLPDEYAYVSEFRFPATEFRARRVVGDVACPTTIDPADPLARVQAHCSARYFPDAFDGAGATELGIGAASLVLVAIALMMWAAVPSGITEYASPQSVPPGSDPADPTGSAARRATALGTWMTTGFRLGRYCVDLHVLTIVVGGFATAVMLPFAFAPFVVVREFLKSAPTWLEPITLTRLLITSGSAIGLLAVAQQFSSIGQGLRPVLNIALDIANYMRPQPRTRTPRARIMERYASLLRFVSRWRSPGAPGRGYDAVVVVAHSQGTVISADIFRYLAHLRACGAERALDRLDRDPAPGVRPLPVYLFTMGSPLRQLYAQRFPHLYQWAQRPDPGALDAVRKWINVYRSGDYVGRALWVGDSPSCYMPGTVLLDDGVRREYTIGAGAHTHYWDGTAAAVGLELDRIIEHVLAGRPAGA